MIRQNRSRQIRCGVIGVVKRKMRGRKVGRCWKSISMAAARAHGRQSRRCLCMCGRRHNSCRSKFASCLCLCCCSPCAPRLCALVHASPHYMPPIPRCTRPLVSNDVRFSRADSYVRSERMNRQYNRVLFSARRRPRDVLSIDLAKKFRRVKGQDENHRFLPFAPAPAIQRAREKMHASYLHGAGLRKKRNVIQALFRSRKTQRAASSLRHAYKFCNIRLL